MPTRKTPALTVDCVIFDALDRLLLVRRKHPPFAGQLALPGGFVETDETTEQACRREVLEETGVKLGRIMLSGVYSKPGRDPRGPSCSIAYTARVRIQKATGGDDAAGAEWVIDWKRCKLAFDHRQMVADAVRLPQPASSSCRK